MESKMNDRETNEYAQVHVLPEGSGAPKYTYDGMFPAGAVARGTIYLLGGAALLWAAMLLFRLL